ncbi:hypothetical protein KC571_03720 [candidate division WWE3 bacterium]|uniref:VOC domain-containing protein n=1 Tax=candidate division WWE3 bacterium TaxID=2053526 RepID=A0A955LIJ7_UNCKA|nr:hypothetical protein [candidate division WWE3 bacterium]
MQASITTTHLELHVPDFEPIKEYYGKLGFEIVWEREPEEFKGYLIMKLDENTLCFWSGNEYVYEQPYFKNFARDTKRGYGVEVILMVEDIEELITQPWGLKDFRVEDPFGYYLRITSKHNVLDDDYAVQ